jgi:hypothetical protein
MMKYEISLICVLVIFFKITSQHKLDIKHQIVNISEKSTIMPTSYSQLTKAMTSLKSTFPYLEGIYIFFSQF